MRTTVAVSGSWRRPEKTQAPADFISPSVIGSRTSPSTLWTDSRYRAMVVLPAMGGHLPPLTPLRTGLAQIDTRTQKPVSGGRGRPRPSLVGVDDALHAGIAPSCWRLPGMSNTPQCSAVRPPAQRKTWTSFHVIDVLVAGMPGGNGAPVWVPRASTRTATRSHSAIIGPRDPGFAPGSPAGAVSLLVGRLRS